MRRLRFVAPTAPAWQDQTPSAVPPSRWRAPAGTAHGGAEIAICTGLGLGLVAVLNAATLLRRRPANRLGRRPVSEVLCLWLVPTRATLRIVAAPPVRIRTGTVKGRRGCVQASLVPQGDGACAV
jgi:hypothetical protein